MLVFFKISTTYYVPGCVLYRFISLLFFLFCMHLVLYYRLFMQCLISPDDVVG